MSNFSFRAYGMSGNATQEGASVVVYVERRIVARVNLHPHHSISVDAVLDENRVKTTRFELVDKGIPEGWYPMSDRRYKEAKDGWVLISRGTKGKDDYAQWNTVIARPVEGDEGDIEWVMQNGDYYRDAKMWRFLPGV
jgi:hypothetical protein